MIDIYTLTIQKAHDLLKNKEVKVKDLVSAYIAEAKKRNEKINAFIEFFDDLELSIEEAQKRFDEGSATTLTGIPVAIKDNLLYKDHLCTAGSKILSGYKASYDGTVISLLKKEGAIIIGRTNMDEFAMGSSTETSFYGNTLNPLNEERVPGGSSGGSAAAVSMYGSLFSLGSDTGGSIRQPAAFCNLVGLKPTYGSFSRYGVIALGSSLDQIGPFTHTVDDSEMVFNALSQYDQKDSTSVPNKKRDSFKKDLKKKIGVPYHFFENGGIQEEVLQAFNKTLSELKEEGYEIIPITLSYIAYSLPVYYIVQPAEASSNLARFDGIRYGLQEKAENLFDTYAKTKGVGFGKEVRRRILLGTYVLSHGYYDAYYGKALRMKEQITKELNSIFESVDVIATPTTPTTAFTFGEKSSDPVSMYLSDIFTVPANITGDPSISIPIGFDKEKLPIGLQMIAPHFNEHLLFSIGRDIEKITQE